MQPVGRVPRVLVRIFEDDGIAKHEAPDGILIGDGTGVALPEVDPESYAPGAIPLEPSRPGVAGGER